MSAHPTRRAVLGATTAVAGGALLAACSGSGSMDGMDGMDHGSTPSAAPGGFVDPAGPEVVAAEARRGSGPVREVRLTATATPLDLGGGRTVRSWAYGDRLPGQEVRVAAATRSRSPSPTTSPSRPRCTGTVSPCATTWTACPV